MYEYVLLGGSHTEGGQTYSFVPGQRVIVHSSNPDLEKEMPTKFLALPRNETPKSQARVPKAPLKEPEPQATDIPMRETSNVPEDSSILNPPKVSKKVKDKEVPKEEPKKGRKIAPRRGRG